MSTALVESHPYFAASKAAGFHQRLGWGSKPALVLIDVCRAYWAEESSLSLLSNPAGASSPDSMIRLLAAARAGGIPVVWCQVRYTHPTMVDGGVMYKKSPGISIWQDGDTRGMDAWMPGLTPDWDNETVVLKRNPSGFLATNLLGQLNALGVDTIVLCGVSTSGCVRATAVDACGYGFRCMVVEEASGDRSVEIQRATLFDLDARFADVVGEAEAVEKMKQGW
ncbi:putative N-carbamoylsarcosine amidase [Pleurostoma richardsiae]|uniref:N-carbamoylsarcosine amidase n=1 Tax=Pleurostoma richardsiae TaxID=41990 RepID=A0AA38RXF8_9PEZI|nr:putative N-carbamoylsarcosine amidase [Pleurostoma richardsiae]